MSLVGRLRDWAERHTAQGHFSPVGVLFHWTIALLILFQLGLGWWMTLVTPVGGDKLQAYELHSAIGLAIFVLAILRMWWRIMVRDPWNAADEMGWRTTLAYIVEHLFYVAFILLPVTGWMMWSSVAPPGPLRVGGIIPWPQLPIEELPATMQWQLMMFAETLHLMLVWALMVLVVLHVGAALKHHFWDRNDVLRGMLPQVPDWEPDPAERQRSATEPPLPKGSDAG